MGTEVFEGSDPGWGLTPCHGNGIFFVRLFEEKSGMQLRINFITLGVDDLDRSLRFYRDGLGFETEGIVGTEFDHGAVVFIDLQPGLRLALWPRASIAHEIGRPVGR